MTPMHRPLVIPRSAFTPVPSAELEDMIIQAIADTIHPLRPKQILPQRRTAMDKHTDTLARIEAHCVNIWAAVARIDRLLAALEQRVTSLEARVLALEEQKSRDRNQS